MSNNAMIPIRFTRYEELMNKAVRLDALTDMIKAEIDKGNKYPIKDEVVLSFLGLSGYKSAKENDDT